MLAMRRGLRADLTGFDPSTFWAAVTRDATPEAGAAERCAPNTRRTFDLLFRLGASHRGRRQLADAFHLCDPLDSQGNVTALAYWIQAGFCCCWVLLGAAGCYAWQLWPAFPQPRVPCRAHSPLTPTGLRPARLQGAFDSYSMGSYPLCKQLHCRHRGGAAAVLADARGVQPPGWQAQVGCQAAQGGCQGTGSVCAACLMVPPPARQGLRMHHSCCEIHFRPAPLPRCSCSCTCCRA